MSGNVEGDPGLYVSADMVIRGKEKIKEIAF